MWFSLSEQVHGKLQNQGFWGLGVWGSFCLERWAAVNILHSFAIKFISAYMKKNFAIFEGRRPGLT